MAEEAGTEEAAGRRLVAEAVAGIPVEVVERAAVGVQNTLVEAEAPSSRLEVALEVAAECTAVAVVVRTLRVVAAAAPVVGSRPALAVERARPPAAARSSEEAKAAPAGSYKTACLEEKLVMRRNWFQKEITYVTVDALAYLVLARATCNTAQIRR